MNYRDENTARFEEAIEAQIDYFRKEYKVTYATIVGVLECVKLKLWAEASGIAE